MYFAFVVLVGAMMQASVFGSVANLVRSFDEVLLLACSRTRKRADL